MAERVCPIWVGYLLASPVRKLFQSPKKILSPYIDENMKVLDIGCAMGFFSLPLARMVGPDGKVICVDMQKKMIRSLEKRAGKAGLSNRIQTVICDQNSLGLEEFRETFDFALASAVVHEVPDVSAFYYEIYQAVKQNGKFLIFEPKGHVSEKDFDISVSIAEQHGFKNIGRPRIKRSLAVLLEKK